MTVEVEATMRCSGGGGVTLPQPSSMGQAWTDAEAPLGDVLVGHWEHIKPQRQKMQGIRLGFSRGLLFLLAFEFLYILYRSGPTVLREKIGLFSVRVANSFKKILLTVKQK